MSPPPTSGRQDARRRVASPYTRSSDTESTQGSSSLVLSSHIPTSTPDDLSGFPTRAQYKDIEATYIGSLHPKKRNKSLITQQMFDRIWDILHNPTSRIDSSQFRYWVRNTFTLSNDNSPFEPVLVMHGNRPIAVAEQFYELLCHCHARVNHGGRDRTLAVIREHYSWVPKRLTASFVAACPTCNMKKSGSSKPAVSAAGTSQVATSESAELTPAPEVAQLPASTRGDSTTSLSDLLQDGAHINGTSTFLNTNNHCRTPNDATTSWPPTQGPLDVLPVQYSESHLDSLSAAFPSAPVFFPASVSSPPTSPHKQAVSLPMSREVSLFDGMPNGMRYMPHAYEADNLTAYEAYLDAVSAKLPESKRPRIPSVIVPKGRGADITPGWRPNANLDPIPANVISKATPAKPILPPLMKSLSEGVLGQDMDLLRNKLDYPASLPESLRALRVDEPQRSTPYTMGQRRCFSMGSVGTVISEGGLEFPRLYVPQIDPTLLFHRGFQKGTVMPRSSSDSFSNSTAFLRSTRGAPLTSSVLRHKPLPPRLDLTYAPMCSYSNIPLVLLDSVDRCNLSDGGRLSQSDDTSSSSQSSPESMGSESTFSAVPLSATSSAGTSLPSPVEQDDIVTSNADESQLPVVLEQI